MAAAGADLLRFLASGPHPERLYVYLPLPDNPLPPGLEDAVPAVAAAMDGLDDRAALCRRFVLGTDYPDTPTLARSWPLWFLEHVLGDSGQLELFCPASRPLRPCTLRGLRLAELTVVQHTRAATPDPGAARPPWVTSWTWMAPCSGSRRSTHASVTPPSSRCPRGTGASGWCATGGGGTTPACRRAGPGRGRTGGPWTVHPWSSAMV